MSQISAKKISYQIDGKYLVKDADVSLQKGEITTFIGPNGAGKTTLLRMLAGLLPPTEGKVELDDSEIQTLTRRYLARNIAFVPQDTHLDFAFTVREIVEMGRNAHLSRFQAIGKSDVEIIKNSMIRADVAHLAENLVTELSGGERQRVIIARSLATEAPILLLDEPTANLDIAHAIDILDLCLKLAREDKTIGIAIHDLNLAARYADRCVLMDQGEIIKQGAADEVFQEDLLGEVFGVHTDRTETVDGKPFFTFYR